MVCWPTLYFAFPSTYTPHTTSVGKSYPTSYYDIVYHHLTQTTTKKISPPKTTTTTNFLIKKKWKQNIKIKKSKKNDRATYGLPY